MVTLFKLQTKTLRLALSLMVLVLSLGASLGYAQQRDELQDLQQQIKRKQQQLEQQLADARALQQQLRADELKIAGTAKALNSTQINLANNRQQQKQLKTEQKSLTAKRQQQQTLLGKQLRSAFTAGNYDYAKMVFNQEEAGKFERVLTYYQYLNKARLEQIEQFRTLVEELVQVNADLLDKQQQLESLQQTQQQQRQTLTGQQESRKQTLTALEKSIDSEAAQIEQLQINEQTLRKAIADAQRAATQRPAELTGLANLQGKLQKPTKGRMRTLFGKTRQGQVRWKGVLFNGSAGDAVRAVHYGKVLFADWLRGFGLVTVLDHGDGYMSLYGHNQALLIQAGDTVEAGETIALVGQSGGQSSPNLYFEIRHKGEAVNPGKWFRK